MKPSKLKLHFTRCHPDKNGKEVSYFRALREKLMKRRTLSSTLSCLSRRDRDGLAASYKISLLIAQTGKPHTIGEELLIPAIAVGVETVLHQRGRDVTNKIPLSNDTIQRRINAMAEDVEDTLCSWLRQSEFSLQVVESTLPGNEAVLLAYVRFIREEHFVEELLFSKELETDTRGESIFQVAQEFFSEKGIPLQNIIAVATDGAPAMVGCHRGFISHLKKIVLNVLSIHCVLHRQHLVARRLSPRLNESLQYVINAVNKIKSNLLNDRLFRQLCDENNEEFSRLLLHTEIRLSKGACLSTSFQLFDSVLQFFEEDDASLTENLRIRKADVAYLADLYFMFNEMNKQLLTEDLNLIKTNVVTDLITKKRNRMQLVKRGDLRLRVTSISPNIDKLVRSQLCEPGTSH
ncbi:hypothetical protein M514_26531 [Trichuris suis]|uniref:DUF4371 domain-containing protein n=1 Tax=Trichuris suis TaxID=68888 RepID=A0A085MVN7_9BILA|nr:hypothetical protein M514_26531 [Trichuris suis]